MRGSRTFDDGHDSTLLDGRGPLEAVGVDSAQELALQFHGIEAVGGFIIVGFDLGCSDGHQVSRMFTHSLKKYGARIGSEESPTDVDVLQSFGISHDCDCSLRLTGVAL